MLEAWQYKFIYNDYVHQILYVIYLQCHVIYSVIFYTYFVKLSLQNSIKFLNE